MQYFFFFPNMETCILYENLKAQLKCVQQLLIYSFTFKIFSHILALVHRTKFILVSMKW